jgi:Activator of Hsp90 ATPase homolog 1-like protein
MGSRKRFGLQAWITLGASQCRRCPRAPFGRRGDRARPAAQLVLTWAAPGDQEDKGKHSRELQPINDLVRLTVTHEALVAGSDMLGKVSAGWPRVLSSLKSQLEPVSPLPAGAE